MNTVNVYLVAEGRFETAVLPTEFINDLTIKLRSEGKVPVYFDNGKCKVVEGLFVPAKGAKFNLMIFDENKEQQGLS